MLSRLWLSALFFHIFAYTLLKNNYAALVTGAAYSVGGYSLWFMQLIDLNSQMLLPLLCMALYRAVMTRSIGAVIVSAVLVALAILGGHPEAAFITVLLAALYALAALATSQAISARSLAPMAVAGAVGLLLSVAAVLPFLNYLSRAWTMHGPGFGFFHLDPRAVLNLVLPGIHAHISGMPPAIPVEHINKTALEMLALPYSETAVPGNIPGTGLMTVALAALPFFLKYRPPWQAWFFAGMLFILIGLTLGLPGFRLIAMVPPFNMNSNFKFFFSEIHACLAILAGYGFISLMNKSTAVLRSLAARPILSAASAAAVIACGAALGQHLEGQILLNLAGLLALVGCAALANAYPLASRALAAAAFSAVLVLASDRIEPFVNLDRPGPAEKEELLAWIGENHDPESRVLLSSYWPPNLLLEHGIKDVRSSDALFPKPYMRLLNEVNGQTEKESLGYFYPSYFTRADLDRLDPKDPGPASDLAADLAVTDTLLARWPLMADMARNATTLSGAAPPARVKTSVRLGERHFAPNPPYTGSPPPAAALRDDNARVLPGLLLHAPGRLDTSIELAAGGDTFTYVPALMRQGAGDGVFFIARVRDGARSRLRYARFLGPGAAVKEAGARRAAAPLASVFLGRAEEGESVSLTISTLPGPRDGRDNDQAVIAAPSLGNGGGALVRPDWAASPRGPYAYKLEGKWLLARPEGEDARGVSSAGHVERPGGGRFVIHDYAPLFGKRGAGEIAVRELRYPGWRAFAKGQELAIRPFPNKTGMAVDAPRDGTRVEFVFAPADFRVGLFVSLATALVSLALFVFGKVRRSS